MRAPQFGLRSAQNEAIREQRIQAKGCHAKHTYLSDVQARCEAVRVLEKYGYTVRAYKCDNCGFFHLTRKDA